jgi:polygalacturonase
MKYCFDILEFGAVPDGTTNNTTAIQNAIDACNAGGGGKVLCPPGSYMTGTLVLKSNVDFHLMPGCKIIGSTDLADYQDFVVDGFNTEYVPEKNTKSLIQAINAENFSITGAGEINGSGLAFYDTTVTKWRFFQKPPTARPRMVMFYNCRNIIINQASFIDSPCWTFWLIKCERVNISQIKVAGDQRMINNDGIDLDACREVTVSDCIFKTADDCLIIRNLQNLCEEPGICENITITNCTLDSWCQGIRIGIPGDGIIRNCTFSNIVIHSELNGIFFENPQRYMIPGVAEALDLYNFSFSNIIIECGNIPIGIVVDDGLKLPRLSDISFSDMKITSGAPITIKGSPETTIRDIQFNNIQVKTTGTDAIILKHCERVRLNNVELSSE